jgi:DNA-binding response OmpR family regulator
MMKSSENVNRVLVVDDEEDIGFLMKMILKAEGYEVQYVQTLKQARAALETSIFYTVFLDLNLENECGLDLIPTIRNLDHQPIIAVITALKEGSIREEVEVSDVDYLIEKPFNRNRILEVLVSPH